MGWAEPCGGWAGAGGCWGNPARPEGVARSPPAPPAANAIFAGQAKGTGAAYAPYLFDAGPVGDRVVLRYTLSTWNPYQVVLMRHRLLWEDIVGTTHRL